MLKFHCKKCGFSHPLANDGYIEDGTKLFCTHCKEYTTVVRLEAAQQSVNPTVLNVREIETICPNCNLVFDVPVPESHSG
jgi:uncharacterized Zn finger protein (UPF0148 family)